MPEQQLIPWRSRLLFDVYAALSVVQLEKICRALIANLQESNGGERTKCSSSFNPLLLTRGAPPAFLLSFVFCGGDAFPHYIASFPEMTVRTPGA